MRKVVLFIAMSLDGYIADAHGGVGWLSGQDENGENIDTYSAFIQDVDTVVMGWNTYHQIVTELSPGEWVYSGLTSYIVTHKKLASTKEIVFTAEDPCGMLTKLKKKEGKTIWICGGADLAQQFMKADLIDEYDLSVIPTMLGSGIRLFDTLPDERKLKLQETRNYNGIVELIYTRR